MYSPELEELINAIIADGAISEKERSVLHRRALAEGIDPDELDVIIEGRIAARNSVPPAIPSTNFSQDHKTSSINASKYGTVRKCPNCGDVVKPAASHCEVCGFEFTGINAVNSVDRLSQKIAETERKYPVSGDEEKTGVSPRATAITSVIANFPIPNTREDLLEFIVFTESKFLHLNNSTDSEVAILRAYKAKYIESVEKANIYFGNDPQFSKIFEKYPENRKRKWREMNPAPRTLIIAACALISFFVFLFILIIIAEANNW